MLKKSISALYIKARGSIENLKKPIKCWKHSASQPAAVEKAKVFAFQFENLREDEGKPNRAAADQETQNDTSRAGDHRQRVVKAWSSQLKVVWTEDDEWTRQQKRNSATMVN